MRCSNRLVRRLSRIPRRQRQEVQEVLRSATLGVADCPSDRRSWRMSTRDAIRRETRTEKENVWLHLFGILRPKIQSAFRLLGVSSFDSASYLRKAWLSERSVYCGKNDERW